MTEWISVKDRLPEPRTQVLMIGVGLPMGSMEAYTTDYYCGWLEPYGRNWARWPHKTAPTHWMPLPQPPKAN